MEHQEKSRRKVTTERRRYVNGRLEKDNRLLSMIVELTTKYMLLLAILFATALVGFFIFSKPNKQVSVPNLVGLSFVRAVSLLQEKNLHVKLYEQFTSDPSQAGKVISQAPPKGVPVRSGRTVEVTVSKGTIVSEVPDMVGFKLDRVQDMLQNQFAGLENLLRFRGVKKVFSDQPVGTVVVQNPKAGTKVVNSGMDLFLVVSRGSSEGEFFFDMTGLNFVGVFEYLGEMRVPFRFYLSDFKGYGETEIGEYYLSPGIIVDQIPLPGKKIAGTDMITIGVRPRVYENGSESKPIENESNPKPRFGRVEIATIPMKKKIGAVTIQKIVDDVESTYLKVPVYDEEITFPYWKVPGVSYKAVDAQGNTLWLDTVTEN